MSPSLSVRLVGIESRIVSGVHTVVFDFVLFYVLLGAIARFLNWYHLYTLYDQRRCLELGTFSFLGMNVGVVVKSRLGMAMTILALLYTAAAVTSGFGINGATVDVYEAFEDREVLLPAMGIRDRPISEYGQARNDTELGDMFFTAIRCSDVDGQGLSLPLASVPVTNGSKLECVDQKELLLDSDKSVIRGAELETRLAPCIFGRLTEVYRLPSEEGGPPDGSRIGLLYSGGDCDSDLNLTCAIGARRACAAKVRIQGFDLLSVLIPFNDTNTDLVKETLGTADMALTRFESVPNEEHFLRAAAQFFSLQYSNSAREISFAANMRLERQRVRKRSGSTAVTDLDAFWFVGVLVCGTIVVLTLLLAVLGRVLVGAHGRGKYNGMVRVEDLLDGVSELLSVSGSCKLSKKSRRKPLYYGISNDKAHIGIKDNALVGEWGEEQIE
ncbi:hypothetical protein FGB62_62g238 [Gracilaria domingensis]|nr:hypothetical protein FGB62_62g238 [Gracilaria domingensis]